MRINYFMWKVMHFARRKSIESSRLMYKVIKSKCDRFKAY